MNKIDIPERKNNTFYLHLVFQTLLLVCLLTGCLPSFDPKAEEHFYQGLEYTKQGNNNSAIDEFSKAIEIDPTYHFAYYNRALAYYRIGNLNSSLTDYNKAIELQPDNVYWIIERGFLHINLGNREEAIIDLEKAQELGIPYEYKERVEEALILLSPQQLKFIYKNFKLA